MSVEGRYDWPCRKLAGKMPALRTLTLNVGTALVAVHTKNRTGMNPVPTQECYIFARISSKVVFASGALVKNSVSLSQA